MINRSSSFKTSTSLQASQSVEAAPRAVTSCDCNNPGGPVVVLSDGQPGATHWVVGTVSGALVCLACQSGQCCCFDLVDGSIANGVGTTGDTFAAALAPFSCDMMLGVW